MTNRGYRAPPGPTSDTTYRLLFVLPTGLPEIPIEPEGTVEGPVIDPLLSFP